MHSMVWSRRTGLGLVARHPNAEFFYLTGSRIQDIFYRIQEQKGSHWSGQEGLDWVW